MTEPTKPKKILTRRQLLEHWWVLPVGATLATGGFMAYYAAKITFFKRKAGPPQFLQQKPIELTHFSKLTEDYAALEFNYVRNQADVPCVLLRLPQVTASSVIVAGVHYAAFSRVCTHLGCEVNPLRNLEAAALTFNHRPERPVLGCPCHFSMFDPLLEGESVFGKALYPLPRVRLEVKGGKIFAVGIEPAPTG
jgi:arsenite oxidase small subunit